MKRLIFSACMILCFSFIHAQQKQTITIQKGTVLHYAIYPPGLSVNYSFTVDSLSEKSIALSWMSESGRIGQFVMSEASVQKAAKGHWTPPQSDITLVGDDYSVICFSRALFKELIANGKTEFDEVLYSVKQLTADKQIFINNNMIDALYLESEQGSKIWLLNNEQFPAILKMQNNPMGVDVEITGLQ